MSQDPIVPYATIDQLKAVLSITDAQHDSLLREALRESAELIVDFCHRDFHLATEARFWDVPVGETLLVDDLVEITEVALWGTVLTAPEYTATPASGSFAYNRLIRFDLGTPPQAISWDTGIAGRSRWGAVRITGTWAYQAVLVNSTWTEVIPSRVTRVNLMLAARLWNMRDVQYSGQGGSTPTGRKPQPDGLLTPDVADLLNILVRVPVPMVVSA